MKILFVSTGNACRSLMAEVIFNEKCNLTILKASSAGIIVSDGNSVFKALNEVLSEKLNVNIQNTKQTQLTEEIIKESDLVISMNSYIKELIVSNLPKYDKKIVSFNEYIGTEDDFVYPCGDSIEDFKKTYDILDNRINLLISKIKGDNGIG